MTAPTLIDVHGQPALALASRDGAKAVVSCLGGQLLSWVPAGGREWLYLSERASYDGGSAVRGGVPVCFPQFADHGPLPRHGFLRTRSWSVERVETGGDHALAVLRCTDDDVSRAQWPHAFIAEISIAIDGGRLDLELEIENTGSTDLSFTGALHTYLRVDEVEETELVGLHGTPYLDATRQGERIVDTGDLLRIDRETDRAYLGVERALLLRAPGRALGIHATHFPDVVVWNPWLEKCASMADMPADGFRRMLCVEAAAVAQPIVVPPGQSWWGRQSLVAL